MTKLTDKYGHEPRVGGLLQYDVAEGHDTSIDLVINIEPLGYYSNGEAKFALTILGKKLLNEIGVERLSEEEMEVLTLTVSPQDFQSCWTVILVDSPLTTEASHRPDVGSP